MNDDVQGLVLAPFHDVVDKARAALENAKVEDSSAMQKAAEKLAKEGDRALKKLEPLCKKHLDEYGTGFTDVLKENDDIAALRTELNEALWEFDDYVEADDFDAEKFAELQALSRKAAPKIYDILMRLKLEHPNPGPEPSLLSSTSERSQPFSSADARHTPDSGVLVYPSGPGELPYIADQAPEALPYPLDMADLPLLGSRAGPDPGFEVPPLQLSKHKAELPVVVELRSADSVHQDEVPPRPHLNPWEPRIHTTIPLDVRETADDVEVELPQEPVRSEHDDAVSPLSPTIRHGPHRSSVSSGGPGILVNPQSPHEGFIMIPETPTPSSAKRLSSVVSITSHTLQPSMDSTRTQTPLADSPVLSPHSHSRASSTFDVQPSSFDVRVLDHIITSESDGQRSARSSKPESFYSIGEQPTSGADPRLCMDTSASQQYAPLHPDDRHMPVARSLSFEPQRTQSYSRPSDTLVEDGLIPVDPYAGPPGVAKHVSLRQADCTIGLNSSFRHYKGFCEGAKDIILGGLGVKRVKRQGIGAANQVVARCKHCMFELEWQLFEADLNKHDSAGYQTAGIGFRLRFLSKSHLAAKNVDDQLYGCLFCIQQGRTTEESDATVFFTQKQLFAHLARHPRPLPHVPGLVVIDGAEIPPQMQANYDLQFLEAPAKSSMRLIAREIAALPAAIATETFRVAPGTVKAPPGGLRDAVLQFAIGSRIVGIEFPARYNGEWAIGWADNVRATFPLASVKLEAPPKREITTDPTSKLRAVARWGRKVKDKEKDGVEWLKFEKGEVLTSISYAYVEHWCWSGYNTKGKWGIFPQAYIEPNTLAEMPGSERGSLAGEGKLSRMSLRKIRNIN